MLTNILYIYALQNQISVYALARRSGVL